MNDSCCLIHKFISIYLFDRCLKAAILRNYLFLRIIENSKDPLLYALYLLTVTILEINVLKNFKNIYF